MASRIPRLLVLGAALFACSEHFCRCETAPLAEWLKLYDTENHDQPGGMAIDRQNNIFISGQPGAVATIEGKTVPSLQTFISKLDPAGSGLWTIVQQSANPAEFQSTLVCDEQGNVYWIGTLSGTTTVAGQTINVGTRSVLTIIKYSGTGNLLWWRIIADKDISNNGWNMFSTKGAIDADGNIYVCSSFNGSARINNEVQFGADGGSDVLIAKLNHNGDVLWMKKAGGGWYDIADSIAIDAQGNVFFSGFYGGPAFFDTTIINGSGHFIAKYSSSGIPIWVYNIQTGANPGFWRDLSVDAQNHIIAVGNPDRTDGSILVLGTDKSLIRNEHLGNSKYPWRIGTSADGGFVLASITTKAAPPDENPYNSFPSLLIEKIDSSFRSVWQKKIESSAEDWARAVAIDSQGACVVYGGFNGSGVFADEFIAGKGGYGIFVMKIAGDTPGTPNIQVQPQSMTVATGSLVTFLIMVQSVSPLSFQWFFNGAPIPNANSSSYSIPNVTAANEGYYNVEVANSAGTVRSASAQLVVKGMAPVQVTTIAGTNVVGLVDSAVGTLARFNQPNGLAYFGGGLIAVADGWNHAIRLVDVNGAVATLAGDNVPGYVDAPGTAARFNFPLSLNMDRNGDVLVTDTENNAIRRVNVFGLRNVTTVAGDGVRGYKDGTALEAEFNFPNDVAVSTNGFIYVSEYSNHTVRVIAPNGVVSTLAGNGTRGYQDGTGTQARFNQPGGLTIGTDGNIYITEWVGNRIRRITPEGVVTTVAGTNVAGFKDGQGGEAQFNVPDGIAADPYGNLYVSEDGNHAIRKIDPQGNVTTIAGLGTPGFKDGDRTTAMFNAPGGIMWHPSGSLYVSDTLNHSIRKISFLQTTNSESAELLIEMNPSVTVFGDAGKAYRIEAAEETSPMTWVGVGNVTLTNGAQQWFDPQPAGRAKRFYRAVKVN
jgi:sugar lactone lactonase YvrE